MRIELIPKKSVIDDVLEYWESTGRESNIENGQFVFDDAGDMHIEDGVIEILRGDKQYYYNMCDFYRVKVIDESDKQFDMFK